MSTRRTPRDTEDQVAELEERLRRLLATLAASPSDVRLLFEARGDLLAALDAGIPERLGVGADGEVLTARASEALGMAWEDVDAIQQALFTGRGALVVGDSAGLAGTLEPGNDGEVLTLDSDAPLGVRWASSAASDAELLSWLAMGVAS